MKTTVDIYIFRNAFQAIRPDNFSYDGLTALFDYLEEQGSNEAEVELDVIAFCCEFTEYADIAEYNQSYSGAYGTDAETIDDIREHTIVIPIDGSDRFITIQDY